MRPIGDHAIIGDCRAAALIDRGGCMDWLCWPRFDSPSLFGALLDDGAGRWTIAPAKPFHTERRYVADTNVLETRFHTEGGCVLLTDLMPVASEEDKRRLLMPDHEILRVITCESGAVVVEMSFAARPDYGRADSAIRTTQSFGFRLQTSAGLLVLRSDMPLSVGAGRLWGRAILRAGDAVHTSLTLADEWPAVIPPLGEWSRAAIARSVAWWRTWASALTYAGPHRDAVMRSALVLKLLVHAPSGAIIAAPTTSLPERPQGELNWDYRFCWLRDASLTVRALLALGFREEAEAFVSWLLQSTRLTQPELRVLYDVHGNAPPPETTIAHLTGHDGARPVRVGNAASAQLQLDVYGEVIDATAQLVREGGTLDRETRRVLSAFGEYVCRNWQQPDDGIWEPRSGRAHNTHSRLLCWTALDRLLELQARGLLGRRQAARFRATRALIRRDIEERAWSSDRQSYVAQLGGDRLDATLLLIPWYGFEEASSPRMRKTFRRVVEELGAGNGLLYRYKSADSAGEGAFGICGFWGAEHLALGGGAVDEASACFDRLCRYGNDVGLFAEEIDPASGAARGNFPQAFTHVGLINAAVSLARRLEKEATTKRPPRREQEEAHP